MAITEAQRRAHDKYFSKAYRQVKLSMPNDEADALDQHCQKYGFTRAGFIRRAVVETMERDNAQPVGGSGADGLPVGGSSRASLSDKSNSGGGGGYSAPVSGGVSAKNTAKSKKALLDMLDT